MSSILRTPAGAGIALLLTLAACLIALNLTAHPCELPDGNLKPQCEVTK